MIVEVAVVMGESLVILGIYSLLVLMWRRGWKCGLGRWYSMMKEKLGGEDRRVESRLE